MELYNSLKESVEKSPEPQKAMWQTLSMWHSLRMVPEAWLPIILRVEKEVPLDRIGCYKLLQEMLQAEIVSKSEEIRLLQNKIITDNPTPPPYPEPIQARRPNPSDLYKS